MTHGESKTGPSLRPDSALAGEMACPPVGTVVVNVDGAVFRDSSQSAWGLITRSHTDTAGLTANGIVPGIWSPIMIEAYAIGSALKNTHSMCQGRIIIRSDAQVLLNMISSGPLPVSPIGIIIQDIRLLLAQNERVSLEFVKRNANKAAHWLAREARSMPILQ